MYTAPTSELLPAVSLSDLANWLVADASDPILPMVALSATSQVVEFLQSELVTRTRKVVYTHYPYDGSLVYPSLSPKNFTPKNIITLPYANLVSIQSVTLFGEAVTDYEILETKPASIYVGERYSVSTVPAVEIEYTAGYGDLADVPQEIQYGVMMLAAFLFEHRGACDANEAMQKSGAYSYLYPFKLVPFAL